MQAGKFYKVTMLPDNLGQKQGAEDQNGKGGDAKDVWKQTAFLIIMAEPSRSGSDSSEVMESRLLSG